MFAAVLSDGSVVTWCRGARCLGSNKVHATFGEACAAHSSLIDYFATVLDDMSVVAWGSFASSGTSSAG